MATSAVNSHGTLLKIGDGGGSESFTTIAEVKDISGPSYSVGTEDVTNHDSAGWREYTATIIEGGEVTFEVNYLGNTTHDTLRTDMRAKTKRNFTLTFPIVSSGTEVHAFAAYITGGEFSAPVEGVMSQSLTLTITGAVTVT